MKRVTILIDGQNLYYFLKSLNLLEKNIKWDLFFKSLLDVEDELIRTYWFRPQKILDTYFTDHNIKNDVVRNKFKSYFNSFKNNPSSLPQNIIDQINIEVQNAKKWLENEKLHFSQIEYSYDQLSLNYDDLEIVKTGILKVNPIIPQYIGEKGVDIALAVKMISLSIDNKCDKIILVSGDYDYAEAIKYVKNNMTKIHIVKFYKGNPPKNRNISRELTVLADKIIDVYESELKSKFNNSNIL